MALIKTVHTPYGIPAEYHKVMELRIGWHNRDATITVGVFVSRVTREAGANCLLYRSYEFGPDNFPFGMGENNVQEAYLALKELPEFIDAEDEI